MRILFLAVGLLGLLGSPHPGVGQRNDSIRAIYIKSYPDKFFLWPVIKQRSLAFRLEDPSPGGKNVEFKPNNAYGLGVGMYLFDLGVELVFAIPVAERKEAAYGKTRATDLQLNILSQRWGADAVYQRYKGFYVSNPVTPVPVNGTFPLRPDIVTENLGVSGVYVVNPNKFSLRSSFTFADRQLKSHGAFLLSGTFNSFQIDADSAILDPTYTALLGLTNTFKSFDYRTYSVAPGYAYNLVIKNFFVSALFALGPAVQEFHYRDLAGVDHAETRINSFVDGRLAVGYSNDRFFAGITAATQLRNVVFDNVRFGSTSSTFRILFGWRFREEGFLKRSVWDLLPPWGKEKD
ncbi:MAG: DUF4421 family protein [Cytophagales bacterium]|nr:DUF4421 family protein [Cytophagales bacterium]